MCLNICYNEKLPVFSVMRNMLLLLFLVFDTATASRNVKINLEQNLVAFKEGYQLRGNMFHADDHFPLAKNNKDMVPGVKRVVMPFYINTFYCWIHFYSKCLSTISLLEGKIKHHFSDKKEKSNESDQSKIRIL